MLIYTFLPSPSTTFPPPLPPTALPHQVPSPSSHPMPTSSQDKAILVGLSPNISQYNGIGSGTVPYLDNGPGGAAGRKGIKRQATSSCTYGPNSSVHDLCASTSPGSLKAYLQYPAVSIFTAPGSRSPPDCWPADSMGPALLVWPTPQHPVIRTPLLLWGS